MTVREAYDEVVMALGEAGLMVVLDNHVSRPQWFCGGDNDGNGFFGDAYFDIEEWLRGLESVARRYRPHHPLRNELIVSLFKGEDLLRTKRILQQSLEENAYQFVLHILKSWQRCTFKYPALGKAQAVMLPDSTEKNGVEANSLVPSSQESPESKYSETRVSKRGMILPFQPLSMIFHNVNYFVVMPKEMRTKGVPEKKLQLLSKVSGVFRPGVLTTLVGSSGAGKITLMDVLAGRKIGGYIEGDIKISGYKKVHSTFYRISGCVEQIDIHSPQVTIEESLGFSASLRL